MTDAGGAMWRAWKLWADANGVHEHSADRDIFADGFEAGRASLASSVRAATGDLPPDSFIVWIPEVDSHESRE